MTWEKRLASNNVTRQPAAKKELDNLRSIVSRSLEDVADTATDWDRLPATVAGVRRMSLLEAVLSQGDDEAVAVLREKHTRWSSPRC